MRTIVFIDKDESFRSSVLNFISSYGINLADISNNFTYKENYSDYIIINSYVNSKERLNCRYCIINMDVDYKRGYSIYGNLISYGFGNKNTATISSIKSENEGFVYCLQRYLKYKDSILIEPQEIPINIKYESEKELYGYMVGITICLMEGINLKNMSNIFLNI